MPKATSISPSVYQIEAGCTRLLWIAKERTAESFETFFDRIGKPLADGIAFVCSDMWKPYLKVIRQNDPNAVNILDRFHIVAKMNDAVNDVRAAEARRLVQDGYQPVLKKSRWCLLKRKENLTATQRVRLREVLRYNLQTVRAYLLKEDFQQFWDYNSPTWAAKFLDEWCRAVMRSPHRAHEEGRQNLSQPPRTHPQLFPSQKKVLQRRRRGPSTTKPSSPWEKPIGTRPLPRHRNRPVPRPRQATRATNRPQNFY